MLIDIVQSFSHAARGIYSLFESERSARLHLFATVCVLVVAIVTELSALEWCVLVIAIGFVWVSEAFNTAIESLGDCVDLEENPGIKQTKDLAAGAVLISAIIAAILGFIVLGSHDG